MASSPTNYTASDIKPGLKLFCNGYPATVIKVCTGVLTGMAEVRVPGGLTCESISELIRFQNYVENTR